MFNDPHLVFFPGVAIMITVLSFNLIGDSLMSSNPYEVSSHESRS